MRKTASYFMIIPYRQTTKECKVSNMRILRSVRMVLATHRDQSLPYRASFNIYCLSYLMLIPNHLSPL